MADARQALKDALKAGDAAAIRSVTAASKPTPKQVDRVLKRGTITASIR